MLKGRMYCGCCGKQLSRELVKGRDIWRCADKQCGVRLSQTKLLPKLVAIINSLIDNPDIIKSEHQVTACEDNLFAALLQEGAPSAGLDWIAAQLQEACTKVYNTLDSGKIAREQEKLQTLFRHLPPQRVLQTKATAADSNENIHSATAGGYHPAANRATDRIEVSGVSSAYIAETRVVMPKVIIIPATIQESSDSYRTKLLRVCGYGRVSTDHEEQANSFEAQQKHYTDKIKSNPAWIFTGFFSDEGITGTSVKHRDGFMEMIAKCKAGKIDLIVTKSISRFSRNTLDSLKYVRILKALGIGVIFEKEGINTLEQTSELLFTLLSAMAQEKSESISKNVKFGKKEAFRQGKVPYAYANWYGYRNGSDDYPEIVPQEAEIVTKIFTSYLVGDSLNKIAKELNESGIPTKKGAAAWSVSVIQSMLQNEKYCGNALLQKTFVADPISKRVMQNNGQMPQYLVKNCHDAIITHKTFELVQQELARRNNINKQDAPEEKGKYSTYALTERLTCSCGAPYRRKTWKNRDGSSRIIWACVKRLSYGKSACASPAIDEYRIHAAIVTAINHQASTCHNIETLVKGHVTDALQCSDGTSAYAQQSRLTKLNQTLSELVALSVESDNPKAFELRFKALSDEIVEHRQRLEAQWQTTKQDTELQNRIEVACECLKSLPQELTEFDDALVRQTIRQIKVLDEDTLKIQFVGGAEVKQQMPER